MNIAVFGGSFDPPHIGHEMIVYKSLGILDIDKLIIVPTFLNPFKTRFYLKPQDRFDLLKKLFDDKRIIIDDYEIIQQKPVQTIYTIKYLKQKYKTNKIYLIIGADNLSKLHLWDNFDELNQLVLFVVVSRDGIKLNNDIISYINIALDINISSTAIRDNLDTKFVPQKIQKKVKELWKKE